jgi:UDP-N-acetyl-D-galactosamine dehydrogenase
MYKELLEKKSILAVIGLGYVGLPIALEFAKKIRVIGFDINSKRIQLMQQKVDPSRELDPSAFDGCDIEFTDQLDVLKRANFFMVAVPTPVDNHNLLPIPDAPKMIVLR